MQKFLLELGKGFSFVKRQYRIATETSEFYIDLVFYNYILKCQSFEALAETSTQRPHRGLRPPCPTFQDFVFLARYYEKRNPLKVPFLAEKGGFEPPVQLPVRQFSKLLVSATHPSLLRANAKHDLRMSE